ncbi:PLP-dependent transferase [Auritidibacter ignavus]|uniref:homocysteine desulfhydrase n=1 Tax=Auritidibacter ignavus TaxID=678932 RepID=A0AAJ6AK01_9MICC|nr:PLP-dependent transferase [Auritidibacter ignavus]WGH93407.1 PLP-dependent transferase [Auritidibacter ignavus]
MSTTSHFSAEDSEGPCQSGFSTQQIHAGRIPDESIRPVREPVYVSVAFGFDSFAQAREVFAQRQPGLTYSRTGNPTVGLLERRLASLEDGVGAVATASGQAAITLSVLALAGRSSQSPDGQPHPEAPAGHVVASNRIYGGTADLLNDSLAEAGITTTWVNPHDPQQWGEAITERTRAFLVESIANPHADLPDIPALAEVAHRHGVALIVDNTLATPYLLQPARLGADLVVHSVTKYLVGNGSSLGGAVIVTDNFHPSQRPELWPQLTTPRPRFGPQSLVEKYGEAGSVLHLLRAQLLNDVGPVLSALNAQQALEGIETLDLRLPRHSQTATELARRLEQHPGVRSVSHPSLESHPNKDIAERDFTRGTGAVFSFELNTDSAGVERFFNSLQLFTLAVNLGDSRSLITHPLTTTHCRLSEELRIAGQINETTVRLAVGREDVDDLWHDLKQGLDQLVQANQPASEQVWADASTTKAEESAKAALS